MIGKHYSVDYNCAHFVSEWYKEKLNIEIPTEGQFEMAFIRWLRNNFKKIDKPVENCLVRMKNGKENHIGVYADYGVYHNHKPQFSHGSVVHWTVGVTKRNYTEVSYWLWSQ
jgi:hypothetical protein